MNKCPITGEACNKHRSYKITEVKDGKATQEFALCDECLASYIAGSASPPTPSKALQAIGSLLGFLTKGAQELQKTLVTKVAPGPCPKCGGTFENIIKTEMVGCSYCYEHFGDALKMAQKLQKTLVAKVDYGPCPKCGGTFENMIKTERVGCSYCYEHFGDALKMAIQKTQKNAQHVGKVPKNWKKSQENFPKKKVKDQDVDAYIAEQNAKMLKVIKAEEYEEAVLIRDKLTAVIALQERLKEAISTEEFEQASLILEEIQKFINSGAARS